jgi:hypothetical protein
MRRGPLWVTGQAIIAKPAGSHPATLRPFLFLAEREESMSSSPGCLLCCYEG